MKNKPVAVGIILKEEFLEPMGITIVMLSEAMGVHRNTVSAIVNGKNINVTQAVLLASALGTSSEFWLNLQHNVDLWNARKMFEEVSKNIQAFDVNSLISNGYQ